MDDNPLSVAADVIRIEGDGLALMRAALDDPSSDLARGFFAAFETIKEAHGRVIVSGMGKSGHIARKLAATLASTGTPAMFVHPAEASHGDLGMVGDQDIVIAMSNSGETPELRDIIAYCGRYDIPLIAVTSRPDSSLGRAADILMPLPQADEACGETRAPTTSTTMTLALGDALAVALLRDKGFSREDFHAYHPGGKLGASLQKVRHITPEGRVVPLVPLGTGMRRAAEAINKGGFGCVGVTDGEGRLIGIVTDGDIRRRFDNGVLDQFVDKVMTKNPRSVSPDTLAAEALGILAKTKITALFVVEDEKPVGLIHVHDMLSTGVM
ncbi:KpsF/GutQ family sugar-phosphate isomerase [Parvularcula sp. LCG005]|uniref:KpsF/GutQ family sugar-phosphate isomerase n=1 Tax=Parvularcula sp. LCG005 TaxID=3078805 RepID=UPI0029422CEC|nr:KpsF/GutQ family sugar-phosphate isomerase [Parvularcula sp. LCG005]WOI52334.1 KpsF/GutQ family sugar-phosphate isomerase [Parvularcula sp. LCG005]